MPLLIHPHNLDMSSNNTKNPLIWGNLFLMYHISSPMSGRAMSLHLLPPKGVVIINLVGFNLGALMPLEVLKVLVMPPLWEGLTLPNKVDLPCHIPINPKWGDILGSPAKRAKIPNRGCTNMRTKPIPGCLMVVLGCMQINIHITKTLRTHSHLPSFHFWQL